MIVGQDGAIANFMDDIADTARQSNGFVLEIGPGVGTGSTLAIQEGLQGHKNPLHITVDERDYMMIKPTAPWWHLVIGDSRRPHTAVDVVKISPRVKAGLIFIDTDHHYDQMKAELPVWELFASSETVWLFHDVMMWGAYNHMNDAIKEFASEYGWHFEIWRTETHGLGRMHK